jgi:hypothetical protein
MSCKCKYCVIAKSGLYAISFSGNIMSNRYGGKSMKLHERSNGYLKVNCYVDGAVYTVFAHRLVYTYLKGCAGDKVINHIDFNKANNRIGNLEAVTHLENVRHAAKAGKLDGSKNVGENNIKAKLTVDQVRDIRSMYGEGVPRLALQKRFNVGQTCIADIVTNKKWSHI